MVFAIGSGISAPVLLASAAASLAIGFVWYGCLFGKAWSRYTGWTDEKVKKLGGSAMGLTCGLAFAAAAGLIVTARRQARQWASCTTGPSSGTVGIA